MEEVLRRLRERVAQSTVSGFLHAESMGQDVPDNYSGDPDLSELLEHVAMMEDLVDVLFQTIEFIEQKTSVLDLQELPDLPLTDNVIRLYPELPNYSVYDHLPCDVEPKE